MNGTEEGGGIGYSFDDDSPLDLDRILADKPEVDETKKEPTESPDLKASREANALLMRQMQSTQDALEAERKRSAGLYPDATQRQPIAPQQPVDVEAMKARFAREMLEDPGGFALRLISANENLTNQLIEAKTKPFASGAAASDISAYRARIETNDEESKAVVEEFDRLINAPQMAEALGAQTHDQRQATLNFMYDAAEGRIAREARKGGTRKTTPPDYSGGATISTVGGGGGAGSMYKGKPLSGAQKEVLRAASDAGITDPARLKKLLDSAGATE